MVAARAIDRAQVRRSIRSRVAVSFLLVRHRIRCRSRHAQQCAADMKCQRHEAPKDMECLMPSAITTTAASTDYSSFPFGTRLVRRVGPAAVLVAAAALVPG